MGKGSTLQNQPCLSRAAATLARTNHSRDRPQYTKKAPPRRYDSYVPDDVYIPSDSYVPNYDRAGKRVQGTNEGEAGMPKDLTQFRPFTQRYMDTINEDPNRPVQVNPTPTQS